ncbi:MAG: ComF family protein [Paludibacteraceae bacterium]|nr:ComF family protein [Paludibacteraceae bacterium]
MKKLFDSLVRLLYPHVCLLCGADLVEGEEQVCLVCRSDLPYTRMHLEPDNRLEQLFWGQVPIQRATALFYFEKGGMVQKLLHQLKYKDNREMGVLLGRCLGEEIAGSPVAEADCIVPVPLHPRRQKLRGYNQSRLIADGMAEVLHLPVADGVLKRVRANETQTHKNAFERWRNSESLFAVGERESLAGRRVLLVDDVVTTGATFTASAKALLQIPNIQINCASVAMAI